jgi:predicted ATPase/DNA-binding CsgD family transcriptional regulator
MPLNFPPFSTPFVGRKHELADIRRLLSDPACRLLTLLGPGGIGKTRLAVEAAQHIQNQFADGVFFVPLQPLTSADFLVSAMAEALRLQFYPAGDPREQLLDYLRDKSLLLVLDNFEHLLAGADFISELLVDAPRVKALVTSRERLNLAEEWVLNVEGLSVPASGVEIAESDAAQLFLQSAERAQVGFQVPDAQKPALIRICQLVGGMPLGIELAAAWVRAMSCDEIAAEIERGIDILATPIRNVPARHRNIRAALEHSWSLLTPIEQTVFKRLSVFHGGFTRAAAEQVTGASVWVLTALVDKSLIRVDPQGRYHVQELLRQYAQEQLEVSGERDAALEAHSAYYAAFLGQRWERLRSDQQRQALDEIDAEIDNIRVAWDFLCQRQDSAALYRAAKGLWLAYDLRCRFHEMVTLFGQAVTALRPLAETPEADPRLGLLLALYAWPHVGIGQPQDGLRLVQEGLALLEAGGNTEDVLLGLMALQLITEYLYLPVASWRASKRTIALARATGHGWALARAIFPLVNETIWFSEQPKVSPARRMEILTAAKASGEEALRLAEECGDYWLQASISGFLLASVYRALKQYPEALRWHRRGLELFELVGQSWGIGAIYRLIGFIWLKLKDYPATLRDYKASLRIFAENGQTHEQLFNLRYISEALICQSDFQRAAELLAFVAHHPGSLNPARQLSLKLLAELEAELPPEQYQAALEKWRAATLETVVADVLAENAPEARQAAAADALTEREIEVLKLMADGLTNPEIAERLVLSVGTVKWYSSQILGKLNVKNRLQAVARADELGLLA